MSSYLTVVVGQRIQTDIEKQELKLIQIKRGDADINEIEYVEHEIARLKKELAKLKLMEDN